MTTTADAAAWRPHIRPATRADLLEVYRLECECFEQPWPYAAFDSHLDAPAFLVAERGGVVVGYTVADIAAAFPGPVGHLKDLAVHPDHRREGLARELLARSLSRLTEAGALRVTLEVRESNEAAIGLYRSAGFEATSERPGYYEDGESAIVMVRSLT